MPKGYKGHPWPGAKNAPTMFYKYMKLIQLMY